MTCASPLYLPLMGLTVHRAGATLLGLALTASTIKLRPTFPFISPTSPYSTSVGVSQSDSHTHTYPLLHMDNFAQAPLTACHASMSFPFLQVLPMLEEPAQILPSPQASFSNNSLNWCWWSTTMCQVLFWCWNTVGNKKAPLMELIFQWE